MACHIHVETVHPDGTKTFKVIDHDEHLSRVWLGKHCFWAMRNGRTVTTSPTTAPLTYSPKKEA